MRIIDPLEEGSVYQIFNRGVNSEDIFIENRNYFYFLAQYEKYCLPVIDTYAFALLKNHFHLLVKIKPAIIQPRRDGGGDITITATKQLSHFFNSYAQSINKAFNRHGKLFEEPFARKEISNDSYFTALIYYIHFNPQQHGFVKDFRDWQFSSYHSILGEQDNFIRRNEVIDWFGSRIGFEQAHLGNILMENIQDMLIE